MRVVAFAVALALVALTTVEAAGAADVDPYVPRYPHSPTPRSNPCRSVCAASLAAASSADCAACCRTARHRVPWNCAAPTPNGPGHGHDHGDSHSFDTHNGVASACCRGAWTAECWDHPSGDNYGHSCDMCGTPNNYLPNAVGCDRSWTTSACWSSGFEPGTTAVDEQLTIPANSNLFIPGTVHTNAPAATAFPIYSIAVGFGSNVTFGSGAFVGMQSLTTGSGDSSVPIRFTFLGAGLQLSSWRSDITTGTCVFALRNAIITLGDVSQAGGSYGANIVFDSTYIPGTWGVTPPPTYAYTLDGRYVGPRYTGVCKAVFGNNNPGVGAGSFTVRGDSGLVHLMLSTQPGLYLTTTFAVDGALWSRMLITGQNAYPDFGGTGVNVNFPQKNNGRVWLHDASFTLTNGGALSFGNGTLVDGGALTLGGTSSYSVEFLTGSNVTASATFSLPSDSYIGVDGAVIAPGATLTPNVFTCTTPCKSPLNRGGVCRLYVAPPLCSGGSCQMQTLCTGLSCAGVCRCPTSDSRVSYGTYNSASAGGCKVDTCSRPCLYDSNCAGPNTCDGNCGPNVYAHFTADCQTQDGTCTPACTGNTTCQAGNNVCGTPAAVCASNSYGPLCATTFGALPSSTPLPSGAVRIVIAFSGAVPGVPNPPTPAAVDSFIDNVLHALAAAANTTTARFTVLAVTPGDSANPTSAAAGFTVTVQVSAAGTGAAAATSVAALLTRAGALSTVQGATVTGVSCGTENCDGSTNGAAGRFGGAAAPAAVSVAVALASLLLAASR